MMTREQVIKGLYEICAYFRDSVNAMRGGTANCTVFNGWAMTVADALALLKEQEPKQVIKQTCHIKITTGYENPVVFTSYDWLCPTCKSLLYRGIDVIDDNFHYCKVCGQAVKWDEPSKEEGHETD